MTQVVAGKAQVVAAKKIKTLSSLGFRPISSDEFYEKGHRHVLLLGK